MFKGFTNDDATKALLEYWQSLPIEAGKLCPYRDDFRMMDISEIADQVFLDERYSDDVVSVVQSGHTLNKILGYDFTGHNLIQLLPESEYPLERAYFRALYDTPCAGYLTRNSQNIHGKQFIYRTTHLPLLGKDGEVRFWVGTGVVVEGQLDLNNSNQVNLGAVQLLEREFFDIGAGLPKI